MVSRFSHLMAVGIEGRRQRGAVVHGLRGFSHYGNSSWFRVFHTWVRWIARTTSSRYKTKRDRRPFFLGQEGGGYAGYHAQLARATKCGGWGRRGWGTLESVRNNLAPQNAGDGLGGGGVRWIGRATTSRDKTRGTGQEEVGYAG
jgi:hypothetical protein